MRFDLFPEDGWGCRGHLTPPLTSGRLHVPPSPATTVCAAGASPLLQYDPNRMNQAIRKQATNPIKRFGFDLFPEDAERAAARALVSESLDWVDHLYVGLTTCFQIIFGGVISCVS